MARRPADRRPRDRRWSAARSIVARRWPARPPDALRRPRRCCAPWASTAAALLAAPQPAERAGRGRRRRPRRRGSASLLSPSRHRGAGPASRGRSRRRGRRPGARASAAWRDRRCSLPRRRRGGRRSWPLRRERSVERHDAGRPSAIAARAAGLGRRSPRSPGLRLAFERGRGPRATPVAAAAVAAALGGLGVMATVVFGSSLQHAVTTPPVYGWGCGRRPRRDDGRRASSAMTPTPPLAALEADPAFIERRRDRASTSRSPSTARRRGPTVLDDLDGHTPFVDGVRARARRARRGGRRRRRPSRSSVSTSATRSSLSAGGTERARWRSSASARPPGQRTTAARARRAARCAARPPTRSASTGPATRTWPCSRTLAVRRRAGRRPRRGRRAATCPTRLDASYPSPPRPSEVERLDRGRRPAPAPRRGPRRHGRDRRRPRRGA